MPYVSGSPNYLSSAGSPLAYASIDGAEAWKTTVQELLDSYRKFDGTNGYTFEIPTGTNIPLVANDQTKGLTFLFFFENWEPITDSSVRIIYDTPFAKLQQRRVGTNGYALQLIATLNAGGTSTTNWDNFNPKQYNSGWLKSVVLSYGAWIEINGFSESIFIGTGAVAGATSRIQGTFLGPDSAVLDIREFIVWTETLPGYRDPMISPALEFTGKNNPPAPSSNLVGIEPIKTRPITNQIKDLYNRSTPGISVHFDWSNSIINSSRAFGAANSIGTLGSFISANRSGSGSFYLLSDNIRLSKTASNSSYILHNNSYNLIGHRVFMVLKPTTAIAGDFKILGGSLGTGDGQRSNITWAKKNNSLIITRWNGTSYDGIATIVLPFAMETQEAIYEIEMSPNTLTVWVNGQHIETVTHSAPDLLFNRLLQGHDSPGYYGTMGDFILMRSDYSAKSEEAATTIRTHLANRFAISII